MNNNYGTRNIVCERATAEVVKPIVLDRGTKK